MPNPKGNFPVIFFSAFDWKNLMKFHAGLLYENAS